MRNNHDRSYNQGTHYLHMLFAQRQTSWQTSYLGNNRGNYDTFVITHILGEMQEKEERNVRKESENALADSSSSSNITVIIATGHIYWTFDKTSTQDKHLYCILLFNLEPHLSLAHIRV